MASKDLYVTVDVVDFCAAKDHPILNLTGECRTDEDLLFQDAHWACVMIGWLRAEASGAFDKTRTLYVFQH